MVQYSPAHLSAACITLKNLEVCSRVIIGSSSNMYLLCHGWENLSSLWLGISSYLPPSFIRDILLL
jgi:ABC-type microcin C transport system permease subunit YejE